MAQFTFGSGEMFGILANGTPIKFGALQESSLDISASQKELFGGSQFALATARGTSKIQGKAKFATMKANVMRDLFWGADGVTSTTGQKKVKNGERAAVPAASPYTITVANSATFDIDLGVTFALNGDSLVKVASAPASGQYSVDALTGIYTFAVADASATLKISYAWLDASAGQVMRLSNQILGVQPTFQILFHQNFNGKQFNFKLLSCTANKLSFASKLEDFGTPDFEFSASANEGGDVMEQWWSDAS